MLIRGGCIGGQVPQSPLGLSCPTLWCTSHSSPAQRLLWVWGPTRAHCFSPWGTQVAHSRLCWWNLEKKGPNTWPNRKDVWWPLHKICLGSRWLFPSLTTFEEKFFWIKAHGAWERKCPEPTCRLLTVASENATFSLTAGFALVCYLRLHEVFSGWHSQWVPLKTGQSWCGFGEVEFSFHFSWEAAVSVNP